MNGRKRSNLDTNSLDFDIMPAELLPSCRIQCQPGCIKIGEREFKSATEALDAYLNQFDHTLPSSLNSTPLSHSTLSEPYVSALSRLQTQKIVDDEIHKAKQDLKIHLLKKALDKSQKREQSYLQREVDDALVKSGELLDKLNTSDDSPVQCPSDIGSLSTDVLLTVNPYQSLNKSESSHVYSYHRTPRSKTNTHIQSKRHPDKDNTSSSLSSSLDLGKTSGISNGKSINGINRSCEKKTKNSFIHLRSRSVSPNSRKTQFKTPSWVQELDSSTKGHSAPSWIDGLTPSDISDSIWTNTAKMDRVNISSSQKFNEPASFQSKGLSFSDLQGQSSMPTTNPSSELRLYTAKVLSNVDKFIEENDLINADKTEPSINISTTEENMNQKPPKVLHTTLDKYIADMSNSYSGEKDGVIPDMPRCSSIDTMLGESVSGLPKSDITGASTIPVISSNATPKKSGRLSVTFSPSVDKSGPGMKSPTSSMILDGDRPWESLPSPVKPPIYVDEKRSPSAKKIPSSPTLSGGRQPGSMEALKKMLYKLQAEDPNSDIKSAVSEPSEMSELSLDMPALKGYNFNSEPGGHSLEKALIHLSRLKNLVERKEDVREESLLNKSSHSAPSSPRR